ncbi:MAG: hypothetical protein HYV09_28995 [Deltaproteobacteria bacterium]|nr:hypothetical protein [Deltaproteobacteria bacterium]
MALDELLSALERDADAEERGELDAARAEAARIAAESAARVARRREEQLSQRELALRGAADAALATSRRDARRTVLAARQRVLDRVLAAAHAALDELVDRRDLSDVLRRDIEEGLAVLGETRAIVRCAPALADRARAIVGARAAVETDPAVPVGVEIVSSDRAVRIDQTLAGRLARMHDELAIAIAARLERLHRVGAESTEEAGEAAEREAP